MNILNQTGSLGCRGLGLCLLLALCVSSAAAQVTSKLWGVSGEAWDPTNSVLRDFTDVGYMNGDVPIPDWPVAHSVTNYGAIPDDGIDDSQAFIDAIAACPDYHAVLVPKGKFTILQKIVVNNDYVCLRGEDMYESVIFFPKYLGEVYIQEVGFNPGYSTPIYEKFFQMIGGTGKSIENLTFEFREQRNKGAWEYEGAGAIDYVGNVSDSWVRNVVFLNYSSGMTVSANHSSFVNLIFDQFNGRCGTDSVSTQNLDAYGSVLVRNCSYNLFHNISVEGGVLQPIDLNEASSHNVYSQYRGGERLNRCIGYHGGSSHFDLYTDLNLGISQPQDNPSRSDETYWNVHDNYQYTKVTTNAYNSANPLIFVGYGDDFAAKTNDPTVWYEPADYGLMTPSNLYLAQLDYFGKTHPEALPGPAPSRYAGDVFGLVPDDDIKVDGNWYYRFDLSDTNLPAVAHARLRVHMDNRHVSNPPYTFHAWTVTDDDWSEDTMTETNKPALVSELDSRLFEHADDNRVFEFDVTSFVRDQLVGGDGVVSLALDITDLSGLDPVLWSTRTGTKPELIIERTESSVPGPPSAPRNIGTTPLLGNILLDWEDHPESNVTYTVYRSPYKVGADGSYTYGYGEYIDNGLVTSDIADIQSTMNWRPGQMYHGVVYRYKIAAVDDHGYESPRSVEIYAATLHPSNDPPAFAGTVSLSNATARTAYSESIAGDASDPESDRLYFHIASGPAWLNVSSNGILSGTPDVSDEGTNAVTFQVTAIGGSTQKVVNIVIDLPADDPPGAPAAPAGLAATADYGSVSLDWNDNSEADLYRYSVYRSTTQGSGYSLMASNLTNSAAVDSNVVNATTYYYVVRAVDLSDNESTASSEVSALPGVDLTPPAAPTGLTATPYNGSVSLNWADNSENDLADYSIFRSTTSSNYGAALVTDLGSSAYSDTNVANGTTYYYVVTATDTNSNESVKSLEAFARPDAGITSISYDFGSGADSIASVGLTTYVENTGEGDMLVTDNPGDGNVGIALYNEQNSIGREAQGFYRTFTGLGPSDTNDFVITTTFTTPHLNWNDPIIGIHLFGDTTASNSYMNTGFFAGVDKNKNLEIWSNGVENGSKLNAGTISAQVLDASITTTIEVAGIYGTYGSDNLQLVLTVSADGVATSSVSATVDTTGFSASQAGFGVSANSDDDNRFVVKTFSVVYGSGSPPSGYDVWASTNGVGAATNDFDGDGLDNLYEYGLDGNPTNALDQGTLPAFTNAGSGLLYIHPQRSDDASLIYTVETSTNLVDGIWTNEGYTVTGTNITGETLNFVTNNVDTFDDEKFIRLKIEQ